MALMMTLMILSVAMLTGLFLNSIIVGEVRVSLNTVNVVNSYYAAESGVERALYFLTTDQLTDNLNYYEGLSVSGNLYNTFANGASYSYATTSLRASGFSATNISNTNPAHVSIIDPRGNIADINWPWPGATGPVNARVSWRIKDCFPNSGFGINHASDRLETTVYSFDQLTTGNIDIFFTNQMIDKMVSVCDCKSSTAIDSCQNITWSNLSRNKYYRFVFRPLDGDVSNLHFELQSGNEPIYSEALVQVDGKYKNSEYRLQAQMSALKPASDIFSFVIFSEEEIIKGQP